MMNLTKASFYALGLLLSAQGIAKENRGQASTTNGFYYQAFSDGSISTVSVELDLSEISGKTAADLLEIDIPTADNFASCALDDIIILEAPNRKYGTYRVRVLIGVGVEGDSGGCLVHIKNKKTEQTQAIMSYSYVTDY